LDGIQDKTVTVTINQVESGAGGKPGFASGGQLSGYGGGDVIPALLEPGEFIVRKERARLFADVLYAINSGAVSSVMRLFSQAAGARLFSAGGMAFRTPEIPVIPVRHYQTGGQVSPAGNGAMDTVRLVFDTVRGPREVLASPARDARALVSALKELARGM
jgi:hypothetical protein